MAGRNLHDFLLVAWIALFVLGIYVSLRTIKNLQDITRICNAIAAFMVVTSSIFIGFGYLRIPTALPLNHREEVIQFNLQSREKATTLPNIYYIILDGYARSDILNSLYQYDNAEFLGYLKQKGFYVASKSRANYMQTSLSLASSLNFEYLDDVALHVGVECGTFWPLIKMIHNSSIVCFLKQQDYTFVNISSGYSPTDIRSAEINIRTGHLGAFTNVFISQTLYSLHPRSAEWLYDRHRKSVLRTFEELTKIPKMKSPVFVFSHIMTPHSPFVFGEHGEEKTPSYPFCYHDARSDFPGLREEITDKYQQGYISQLKFINEKIKATINNILSKSTIPPIIILQADHGPGSMLDREDLNSSYIKERIAIFNAYYFPDNGHKLLYDEITPVNTFRVILNHYFGTDLELLEDKCYFSTKNHPYEFIDVTTQTTENRSF